MKGRPQKPQQMQRGQQQRQQRKLLGRVVMQQWLQEQRLWQSREGSRMPWVVLGQMGWLCCWDQRMWLHWKCMWAGWHPQQQHDAAWTD
jgi:hypothetical protein